MKTKISLVRHGLVHNPTQVYYGRLPGFSLSETGRAQAAATGRYLADQSVAAVYCSPMQRALETAGIVRAQLATSPPLMECALLNEIHSLYDGQTVEEMERLDWDFYSSVTPPYERPADVLDRILSFFAAARRQHPGQHVVGVSHGDPIAFAVMWANGRALLPSQRKELAECGVADNYPAPASVSTFVFGEGEGLDVCEYRYACPWSKS